MKRSLVKTFAPWLLVAITATVLLTNLPDLGVLQTTASLMLVATGFTALALYFRALLSEGALSPAHLVGVLVFLAEPQLASTSLWFIALGGLLGWGALRLRAALRGIALPSTWLRTAIYLVTRVTLSFFVAGQMYLTLNGSSDPFQGIVRANLWSQGVLISAYSLVYLTVYFSIFLLEMYDSGQSLPAILHDNITAIFSILVLPIPFAVLGAELYNANVTTLAFVILLLGLVLLITGLYSSGLAQFQLRRQVNEMRSLSVVTQAMRTQLNLDTLLKTIYLQVAHLLDVNNFLVALYDRQEKHLDYPLVIRQGEDERRPVDDGSIAGTLLERVLTTRSPLLISQDVAQEARKLGVKPPQDPAYSWLGVPLLASGHTLGAMVVTAPDARQRLTSDHLRLLNIVAASASIAIENAQLYQQQTERVTQLATLNNITALLSGTLASKEVFDTVISSASIICNSNAVALYLFWDDNEAALALARSAGLSDAFLADPPDPLLTRLRAEQPLHLQPPLAVNDAPRDRRAVPVLNLMLREQKPAWVELPLFVGDKALGILVAYYDHTQTFSGEQIELMRTFATQAAQAINNARLYSITDEALERRVEQLYALAAIGRLLTATMSRQTICDLLLTYATDATKAAAGAVVLKDSDGEYRVFSQRGYPEGVFRDPALTRTGITGRALRSGQIIRRDDVRKDSDYVGLALATSAQLTVPILRGRETLGVITVEAESIGAFTQEDEHFIGQIASQAIIAIDNMNLFSAITEARDRLQTILDAIEDGMVLLDARGYIALANPRISLIGLDPDKLPGQSVDDLLLTNPQIAEKMGFDSGDDLRLLVDDLRAADALAERDPVNFAVQGEHGTLHIQRQIIPVRAEDGEEIGALMMFYNKTEETELEQTRQDLSRMIVHDLRSPLTAVTTSLKLLRELVPKDAEFYKAVMDTTEASQRAIRKLLSRVDALLDISKMESGQLTLDRDPTELATMVDSVCVELSPIAHEMEIKLVSEVSDSLPLLLVDADKVERLLLNLVDNALKYAPMESDVIIRAYLPGTHGALLGFMRIEVADQGPGIPAEYRHSLFDRYVQVQGRRGARRGTGLGLTFCRLVTEAHGGRIWIEDNHPKGTVFAVTLPVLSDEPYESELPRFEDEYTEMETETLPRNGHFAPLLDILDEEDPEETRRRLPPT